MNKTEGRERYTENVSPQIGFISEVRVLNDDYIPVAAPDSRQTSRLAADSPK